MFQPSPLFTPTPGSTPPSDPPPFHQNRIVGGVVLLTSMILILMFAVGADAEVFTPYNATLSVTQTAQARGLPSGHPTLRPGQSVPRFTPIPPRREKPARGVTPPDRKL
jgi:hypothetical protein